MSANTLRVPRHRDPIARATLMAIVGLVAYLGVTQPDPQAISAQEPIIVLATPALRQLPTAPFASVPEQPTPAQPQPTAAQSGLELAAPTFDPAQLAQQQPTAPPPAPQHIIVERIVEVQQIVVATPTAEMVPPLNEQPARGAPGPSEDSSSATPAPGDPGFADSFATPDPAARCMFVGCLSP